MDLKEAGEIAQRTLLTAERERIEYADKEAQRTGCGHEAIIRAQAEEIRCIKEQRDNALRELTDTRGYWHAARATIQAQAKEIKTLRWWKEYGQALRNAVAELDPDCMDDESVLAAPAKAKQQIAALKACVEKYDNDEASVCPEDVGFVEYIRALQKQIAALKAEVEKLKNDIRIMVDKAADKHLEGYRELGRRAAEAENARDRLQAEVERLTEKLESREATIASMKVEAQPAFIRLRSQLSEYELEVYRLVKMLGGTKTLATELMRQEMELNSLRTGLAEKAAEVKRLRADYLEVADAVCRESTGPEDVARQARALRARNAVLEKVAAAALEADGCAAITKACWRCWEPVRIALREIAFLSPAQPPRGEPKEQP